MSHEETEHGIDERGGRYIVGDLDDLYEIHEGAWYGWPDFASGIPLNDPHWGTGGQGREPVLAEHPDPNPPKPEVSFEPHAGSNGVSVSADERFGFVGDALVALFGDLGPVTTPRLAWQRPPASRWSAWTCRSAARSPRVRRAPPHHGMPSCHRHMGCAPHVQ